MYEIFYDVNPSEVKKQNDCFSKAFRKHERDEDRNEVKQWRNDLKASTDSGGRKADGYTFLFTLKFLFFFLSFFSSFSKLNSNILY